MTATLNRFGKPLDFSESVMQQRFQWSLDMCTQLPDPVSKNNSYSFVAWATAEGGGFGNEAVNNVLNCTVPMPGSTDVVSTGGGNFVQAYTSYEQGIQATIKTLTNGLYLSILTAFSRSADPTLFAAAVGASPWGTSLQLLLEVIPEAVSIVNQFWINKAGEIMFISSQGKTWMFVGNGLNSFWRQTPVAPTQYPVEPDPNGVWFSLWMHEENGKLVQPGA